MSLADLSGTQDEGERWRGDAERKERATLGGRRILLKFHGK